MAERSININRQQQQKIRNAVADYRWKSGTNVQLAEFGAPIIEPSNSPTPSVTPSFTMTPTVTQTPSTTISITPTRTPSNTVTPTVTMTPTSTATPSNTIGASSSTTPSFTQTPTKTPSNTATPSVTQTPSNTLTPSNTNTPTATPSNTVTSTPSLTPSVTPSITTSPTATIPVNTFIVTANGSSAYIINGQSNPTLSTSEGQTYTFSINASGHPFWIKTVNSTGTANAYNDGVTNNGTDNGTITFVVPYDAPSTLYYNCQFHASMAGTINVIDVPAPTATPSNTITPTVTQTPSNTATPSNSITPTPSVSFTYTTYYASNFGNQGTNCGSQTLSNRTYYGNSAYTIPTVGQQLYTTSDLTQPWLPGNSGYIKIFEYPYGGLDGWEVGVDALGIILTVSSCVGVSLTPSNTATPTPTYTPSNSTTPSATPTGTPTVTPSSSSSVVTLAGSLLFNGSTQTLGMSPGVTFGAGAFTLEGWFYNNSSFTSKGIIGSPVTSPTGCMNLYFANNTTITSDRNGGGGSFSYTMATPISLNQWHYLIYNRNSGGLTAVYIDGVRCNATSNDTLNYSTATDTIGRYYGGYWPGYWTNMRMTIGTAVYNSTLSTQTNPTSPLTSLANTKYLMLAASVTTDTSGIQTITNNNGVTQTSTKPF